MRLFANLFNIASTKIAQYPGDTEGDSIIATGAGSAEKGETAQVYGMAGLISNPANGVKGIRLRLGSLDILLGYINYKVPLPTDPGETKLYSTDSDGNEQATVIGKADGVLEVNGNADFAVAFNDLKTAFDQLKSDYDSLVSTYNTHTHPTAPSGPVSGPSATGSSSTADIDPAKIDTVRMP